MDKRVKEVISKILEHGYQCYIVGGYVRDYLLNKSSNDYDLCTDALPDILKNIFSNYKLKQKLGTIFLYIDELCLEITTFRQEVSYQNRKPLLYNYTTSLKEDLQRRDFTINTLCMDINEQIIDLLNAKQDINNKIIRMVGHIDTKIKEDPLRILRALRFSVKLSFVVEDNLYQKMLIYKHLLRTLSYERKKEEIDKIIECQRLDILIPFQKELEINLDKIEYYNNSLLTWIRIDKKRQYLKTKKELKIVDLVNKHNLKDIDLYHLTRSEVMLLSEYHNNDYLKRYDALKIKRRQDIQIRSEELLKLFPKEKLNKIYQVLELKIINQELINNYDAIMSYLILNKHKL